MNAPTNQARLHAEQLERESGIQRAHAIRNQATINRRDDGMIVLTTIDKSGRISYTELGHTQHCQLMSDLFEAWEQVAS